MTAVDREELRNVVASFFKTVSSDSDIRSNIESEHGYDPAVWKRMANELGVQGLLVPEDLGGAGLSWAEAAMVFQESGRTLLGAPLLATVLADAALAACRDHGTVVEVEEWRTHIADGSLIASFAVGKRQADNSIRADVVAREGGDVVQLSGVVSPVVDAGQASLVVVGAEGPSGFGLYALDTTTPGVATNRLGSLDLTRRLFRLELRDAQATPLAVGKTGLAAAHRLLDLAGIALACEQLGSMERLLHTTVEYTMQREQFGRPIGSFQAVKHSCADMLADIEASRAMVEYAAIATGTADLPAISALVQAQVTENGTRVAAEALQLHGAMAYTWEHMVHLYLRRAKTSEFLLGSPVLQRERLVGLIGL
ncbi:hypothetical protein A5761_09790 [Mycolicibacterium setense]|nr:hypothetical protein A5761_09790 [Mycolicibacterium setense]